MRTYRISRQTLRALSVRLSVAATVFSICTSSLTATATTSSLMNIAGYRVQATSSISVSPEYQNNPVYKHLNTDASKKIEIDSYYFPQDVVAVIKTPDGSNVIRVHGATSTEQWAYGRNRSLSDIYLSKQPDNLIQSVLSFWPVYHTNLKDTIPGSQQRVVDDTIETKLPFRIETDSPNSYYYFVHLNALGTTLKGANMYFVEADPALISTDGVDFAKSDVWAADHIGKDRMALTLALSFDYTLHKDGWPSQVINKQYTISEIKPIVRTVTNISSISKFDPSLTPEALVKQLSEGHQSVIYDDVKPVASKKRYKWLIGAVIGLLGIAVYAVYMKRSRG